MRPLALPLALLAACATQATPSQHAPKPAPVRPAGPVAWHQPVNDLAAAAAVLAEPKDFEGHPIPRPALDAPVDAHAQELMVLHDMTLERFLGAMHGMTRATGQRCDLCHVMKPEMDFASDKKNEKRMARGMLIMSQWVNHDFLKGETKVTCWTCHRGEKKPAHVPAELMPAAMAAPLPPNLPAIPATARTASEVYKNLQLMGGMKPQFVVPAMQTMAAALGTDCKHCHDANDWASDAKPEKRFARTMFALSGRVNAELFGTFKDDDAVSCWTCHRGELKPQRLPPGFQGAF